MTKFIQWIPTQTECIDTFFKLCPVNSSDIVYDLGSGDGRLLFAALEKGAGRCVGIEIDPNLVRTSLETAEKLNVNNKISFIEADIMDIDLSEATVIFSYIFFNGVDALRPKFEKELKPGTRIVMELYPIPGWKPAQTLMVKNWVFYYYDIPFEKTDDYEIAISRGYEFFIY